MKKVILVLGIFMACFSNSNCRHRSIPNNNAIIQDSSFIVVIDNSDTGVVLPCDEGIKRHIYKDFFCTRPATKYQVEIIEDSTSTLKCWQDGSWVIIDTLSHQTTLFDEIGCRIEYPKITMTDFNNDGYQDILCYLTTNVNGNLWGKLFLYNAAIRHVELIPSAEDDGIWAAPEFNPKKHSIESFQLSGVYGLSYTSRYKLVGNTAQPLRKTEEDNTGVGMNGHGGVKRIYRGDNGKWKLVKAYDR